MTTTAVCNGNTFARRVIEFVERVTYRRAETAADLDAIRHLRYAAYLKEGAIEVREDERLVDEFDDLGKVANIGLYYDDKLISALRIHFLEELSDVSPATHVFPEVLGPYLAAGNRIIDPSRLVTDYGFSRAFPELPYAALRLSVMASEYHRADFAVATLRAEHQAAYRRAFFATPVCPPRDYPLLSKKIGLMLVNYKVDRARIYKRGPYFASTAEERSAIFAPRPQCRVEADELQNVA
ncbi:MAG: N-acyl amino acid synthase FeeM domain-containing protein [Beijerinckiaceae bacterium]